MVAIAALLTTLVLIQDPQATQDVVEIDTGAVLTGEVLRETDGYLEMRLAGSTVVGFERRRIVSVRRGVADDAGGAVERAPWSERDEWFVLHDAEGRAVGKLHATVTATDDGRVRLGEEWTFVGEGERTEVTVLEVLGPDLEPASSFWHERVRRVDEDEVLRERLVDARVEDGELRVESRVDLERIRVTYPWRPGMSFPLAVVEHMRRERDEAVRSCTVWDPVRAELVQRTVTAGLEKAVWIGEGRRARRLTWRSRRHENREWIAPHGETLRREVNGPALVAVPCEPARADHLIAVGEPRFPPARVVDPDEGIGLWLPHPGWEVDPDAQPGTVALRNDQQGASACLMAFDQIDSDVALESAAEDVLRWLALARPGAKLRSRDGARVRDRGAVVLELEAESPRRGGSRRTVVLVYVFAVHDRVLGLCLEAPLRGLASLQDDFERIVQTAEIHPEAVDPPLQGPLATRTR